MIPSLLRTMRTRLTIRHQVFIATGLTVFLALVVMAMYWSGLGGAFLLDDTPNLNVIAQLPPNPSLDEMLSLATTGSAGILGRPVSVFTFLLQHESWPDPRNFKFLNLIIHLLNGCLLALCCMLLAGQWRPKAMPVLGVAAVSFIWLVHPIQVSTVLYVVQRMTLLSAMFNLLSIIFYLLGRKCILRDNVARGLGLMAISLGPLALLAVLSKENGVLIYLYVLVLEYTLLANSEQPKLLRRIRQGLLLATVVIGLTGLIYVIPSALQGYDLKPFSFLERVLAQFPVLVTYLASIVLLLPNHFGVFHDDFANAQGISLLLSAAFILGLITIAFVRRGQWPLFSFAVLWYFAGHALESTFLPLEYYFEHRNYLSLFGPVFAFIVFGSDAFWQLNGHRRNVAVAFVVVFLAYMSFTTLRQTSLWGDALSQAVYSVAQHPNSPRAQSNLVEKLTAAGEYQAAFDRHMSFIDSSGSAISPYIRWLEFSCILPGINTPEDEVLGRQARGAPHDYSAIFALNNLVFGIQEGRCPGAPVKQIQLLLEQLATNYNFAVSRADIVFYRALLEASEGSFSTAAKLAADSFQLRPDVRVGLYRVNWLIRSDRLEVAEGVLNGLKSEFTRAISSSADLTARVQFLDSRLLSPAN